MTLMPMQVIYKSVILSRLLYASSAWWGFTNAADRQRMEEFVRRGVWSGFYSADSPTVAELVSDADSDDSLFQKVLNNQNRVLHKLLPEQTTAHDYHLRPHDRSYYVSQESSAKLTNQRVSYAFTSSPLSYHARHILSTSKFQRCYSCILLIFLQTSVTANGMCENFKCEYSSLVSTLPLRVTLMNNSPVQSMGYIFCCR